MELDDASIASFSTARVFKVTRVLSSERTERSIERKGEQESTSFGFSRSASPPSSLTSSPLRNPNATPPTHTHIRTPPLLKQSDPPSRINSLCFHRTAPLLFAASDEDDSLRVIDSSTGDLKSTVPCPRHGVSLVVATHAPTAVLHASNKDKSSPGGEAANGGGTGGRNSSAAAATAAAAPPHERLLDLHAARYLDLHSNAYLRYFKAHAARLCALSLSPSDDAFVTAAEDGTVRFWDLRAPSATGALDLPPTRVAVGPGLLRVVPRHDLFLVGAGGAVVVGAARHGQHQLWS